MRMYQPAWFRLRDNPNKPLVIAAAPHLHARIYKAIIKEKYMDTVWHLQVAEKKYTSTLAKVSNKNTLTITLHITPTIAALF